MTIDAGQPNAAGCRADRCEANLDPSRREFLLQAGGCFTGLLLALGLQPDAPVVYAAGTQSGNERRYPIPAGDGVSIDRDAQVILVRVQGKVYAFNLSCPHENASVKWLPKDMRFQCTKHDSQYQPDGTYTSGRATRNMDRLPIRRDGDAVVVDLSKMFQSDKDAAAWGAATLGV